MKIQYMLDFNISKYGKPTSFWQTTNLMKTLTGAPAYDHKMNNLILDYVQTHQGFSGRF